MTEIKLYWDPKSNLLFFPDFETKPVKETKPRDFVVERFRPCDTLVGDEGDYSFEAVYIARFGRWDVCGCCFRESTLRKLVNYKDSGFQDADMRANFRKFVEDHPRFENTRFATDEDDCVSGVPMTACT